MRGARTMRAERFALARTRGAIDAVDDGMLLLLAARRRLVRVAARLKSRAGLVARPGDYAYWNSAWLPPGEP